MATTTTNFGWDIPQSTDLVKDGATAIAALGQDIDTALVDLKGGTTGQILSKASNTDLDYTWINNDQGDITEVVAGTGISGGGTSGSVTITNSMATAIDAKGDLVAGTGADAFARLAVGANNTVLTADSTTATGLKWATPSAGGYTQLATGTLGTSGVSLTSISTSYRDLVLIIRNVTSATTSFDLRLTINNLTGANNYRWSGYQWGTGSASAFGDLSGANCKLNNGGTIDGTQTEQYAFITLLDYANATNWKHWSIRSKYITSGGGRGIAEELWGYYYDDKTAITRLDVVPSTGTITGGTYVLYGVS